MKSDEALEGVGLGGGFRVGAVVNVLVLGGLMLAVWLGPLGWFRARPADAERVVWVAGGAPVGWKDSKEEVPAEVSASLGAKVIYSGTMTGGGDRDRVVRGFLAERSTEDVQGASFFSHTPDRCWPGAGWRLEPSEPERVEVRSRGVTQWFERRIFRMGSVRELVYFGAMVDGQAYGGRMDHYLGFALETARLGDSPRAQRVFPRLEARMVDWFDTMVRTRTRLSGRAQFLRVSTSLNGRTVEEADRLLAGFLGEWPEMKRMRGGVEVGMGGGGGGGK